MEKDKAFIKKIWPGIDKALEFWCIIVMLAMTILVLLTVFLRYVFNVAFNWTEELIILLFITTTYFGSILCVHENEHIDISFLREHLNPKAGRILGIVIDVINMVVMALLAFISFRWIQKTGSSITPGLAIPYTFIYIMFPISFGSMAVYTLRKMIGRIKAGRAVIKEGV
ncbi:MAG: TRAP transporter small permease [Clostridia bacterium]|nr:TRAP transporter small permease [Clostridia bacterium]